MPSYKSVKLPTGLKEKIGRIAEKQGKHFYEIIAAAVSAYAEEEGLGEVKVPAAPRPVVAKAQKFLLGQGDLLPERVKDYAGQNLSCAVALAWTRIRFLGPRTDGEPWSVEKVGYKLNENEPEGVRLFLDFVEGDFSKWVRYVGEEQGDYEDRLQQVKAALEPLRQLYEQEVEK